MADKPKEKQEPEKLTASAPPMPGLVEFDENGELVLPKIGGRFSLVEEIGSGGMGKVYKAQDSKTNQIFALKVLHSSLAKDSVALKRFHQEIEAYKKMNHINLVSVYEQGEMEDGAPYFVMDYVEGITLSEFIEKECEIASSRAIELFLQICQGLKEAHSQGVIHRDLKPSNILLTENEAGDEIVKLADFGIARVANDSINYTQTLTETADVVGSPKYMSPEQCAGNPLDSRSDIYSLGCVMYEMMTKRPPFEGNNPIQVILKQINEEPKFFAQDHTKDSPFRQLNHIIFKCLFKEPSDRYKTIDELITDLNKVKSGETVKVFKKSDLEFGGLITAILVIITITSIAWVQFVGDRAQEKTLQNTAMSANVLESRWALPSENKVANQMQSMAFMHFKKRSYKQALPALKYVAETHKKSGRNYGEYFAYQCIGQCYLSLGQYEEALPWYEKAVNGMLSLYGNKLNRIDPETRSGYVTVLQKLGKQEQSKEVLKSLSLENLASLINFYQDENLPVEAKRVESQLQERQSL